MYRLVLNWHKYNESLVRRGEILLDFDCNKGYALNLLGRKEEAIKLLFAKSNSAKTIVEIIRQE